MSGIRLPAPVRRRPPIGDLLAAGGRFAEFWRQQHDVAGWRIAAGLER